MTKIAYVTGSTGFVGLNLIDLLVEQGWRVLALHRSTSETKYLYRFAVEPVIGDIGDPSSLARTLPRNVDAVFHLAGSTSFWSRRNSEQNRINIDGTRNIVDAALKAGARRFIHTSSNSAFGIQNGIIDEMTPQRGDVSWINYQRSKFLSECEVRAGILKGLDAVILNPASIIGPYITGGYRRLFKSVSSGTLPGVPPGALSFCHSREVANAHVAAFERGRNGENYLLGGADASLMQLVQIIGELAGKPVPGKIIPAWILQAMGRVADWASCVTGRPPLLTPESVRMVTRDMFCDCSKAKRELGYQSVTLREMVKDCYKWLRQEGLLAD